MDIQWFPGHMTKALRMLEVEVKLADVIYYVLDSRAPFSCVNPELNKIAGNKPFIYILNKADMADDNVTTKWKNYFTRANAKAIVLNSTKSNASQILIKETLKTLSEKLEKYRQKGINKPLRAMIIGVPNSGKSTLTNNLCGKAKAVTGNKPGVTRGKQWVRISEKLEVLDTPGTLWPSFEDKNVALNLAFIGSIKDDVLNTYELSLNLIEKVNEINPSAINSRFSIITEGKTNEEILELVAKKRGFIMAKSELDLERASLALLDEFRKGKLGKISLEEPKNV